MLYTSLFQILIAQSTSAQMFNFFGGQQQQQQHHHQPKKTFEDEFLNNNCKKYLCPDTQQCVNSVKDCPCPFPNSQIKCPLKGNKEGKFVCISKPAINDHGLNELYDDPSRAPHAKIDGLRDCGWVNDAYNGLV